MTVKSKISQLNQRNEKIDSTLRPQCWEDYVGQERVKKNLGIIIEAAKKRKEVPEHLLFYGGSGLGKTSLVYLIAKEMGVDIRITSGPVLEKVGDLAAILTNLQEGNILFIDECHRVNRLIEEYLYPAMEDFKLHIILGKGPMAKIMELNLPHFTLIGATTRLALLSPPLRNRFGATFQLNFYQIEDIGKIITRSAKILGLEIEKEAIKVIANSSRFTPRIANRLLKRVRDFAQVKNQDKITLALAEESLSFLDIDQKGLEKGDRFLLEAIIKKFQGGPVGLRSLAAATYEEEDTILDIYEPYLMQLGFIERTPQGRMATKLAYEYLKMKWPNTQSSLV